jgi:hypothetical protein
MNDRIQSFDNMDEMMAAMAANEDEANRHLTPGQIRLRDADTEPGYWAQALPGIDLVVYGIAESKSALITREVGFDVHDNRERGYLTGLAYSAAAPTGEFGDTHVSQVIPIGSVVFVMAEHLGWPTFTQLANGTESTRTLGQSLARAEMRMKNAEDDGVVR